VDTPIGNVSDTAFWVATFRANESERPDALFRDPFAARLVEGQGRDIAAQMENAEQVGWSVVLRTRIIDDFLIEAIANGADLVLNLGAGLDTRPYRLALPRGLPWIEVDFDRVLSFKATRLVDATPTCALERIPCDLSDTAARRAIFAEVGRRASNVIVLTEGVVPYLSVDDVAGLADDLHAAPSFQRWINERYTRRFLELRNKAPLAQQMANAPFRFDPEDWDAFFLAHGWRRGETRFFAAEGKRHHRSPPIPWWWKLVVALTPEQHRREFAEMSAFVILERV
jgi:methyltransferase (TIGR00027 family)